MEAASGENLTEFFNDWIYNEGYPSYTVSWNQISPTQISVTLNQTQSHASVSFFEAPVPIRILGSGGETIDTVLNNTTNGETFNIPVTFSVSSVLFDPDAHLISKNNTILGIDNINFETQFVVYPNPTLTDFEIKKPSNIIIKNIKLFNSLGKLVLETTSTKKVSIKNLSAGIYFVEIDTNKGKAHKQLIKQ